MTQPGEGYQGDDFYCDVAIPNAGALRVEHDDDWILAFHHTRPYWKNHVVVVPKKHIASLTTVGVEDREHVTRLLSVVQDIARRVENRDGEAAVLTNLGRYQDSKPVTRGCGKPHACARAFALASVHGAEVLRRSRGVLRRRR